MSLDTNWLCVGARKKDMNQRKNPATESFCISKYVGRGEEEGINSVENQRPARSLEENLSDNLP